MQKAYNFVAAWGAPVSLLIGIGTFIADLAGWIGAPNWRILYVVAFVLLSFSYFWLHINYNYGRPRVVVRKYYIRKWTVFTSEAVSTTTTAVITASFPIKETRQETRKDDYDFAFIEFQNIPKIKTENSSAIGVIAEVTFYNKWGKELLEDLFYARWWEESEKGAVRTLRKAEIPSNGEIVKLAFASSHVGEDIIFAYGVDSLTKMEWRHEKYLLKDKEPIAVVSVRGTNMDDVPLFALRLGLDNNKRMTLEEIELPKWVAAEHSVHPTGGSRRVF